MVGDRVGASVGEAVGMGVGAPYVNVSTTPVFVAVAEDDNTTFFEVLVTLVIVVPETMPVPETVIPTETRDASDTLSCTEFIKVLAVMMTVWETYVGTNVGD